MTPFYDTVTVEEISDTATEIAALTKDLQAFIEDLTELYVVRIPLRLEPDPQYHNLPRPRARTSRNKPKRPPRS